nr:AAA family ATPase [Cellulomonas sp. APG4]
MGGPRRAVVDELVRVVEEASAGSGPRWVSLEAPSGWGKTRLVQETYRALAERGQSAGRYWPLTLTHEDDDGSATRETLVRRKQVRPRRVEREAGSLPAYFWWGLTATDRNGAPSVALAQDLVQFEGHLPFLMARARQLSTLREKAGSDAREVGRLALEEVRGELTDTVLELAGLGLPGVSFVWRLGRWTSQKVGESRARRRMVAHASTIETDHGDVVDDAATTIGSVARPGLPVVIAVEDLHHADPTLLELLDRLLGGTTPVVVLTTAWPGSLETHDPLRTLAATHGERLSRLRHDGAVPAGWPPSAHLGELGAEDLHALVRRHAPGATDRTVVLLTERFTNPLQLELACALRSVTRRVGDDGVLDLTPEQVTALPASLDEMYQQMWLQLPEPVQAAVALMACGIPAVIAGAPDGGSRSSAASTAVTPGPAHDERWDQSLLLDVARTVFADAPDLLEAMDEAPTGYAWAEQVEQTLYQFVDPSQLRVATGHTAEFFSGEDLARFRARLLEAVTRSLRDPGLPVEVARHRAAVVLALRAEGFEVDDAAVTEATRVDVEARSEHVAEAEAVAELVTALPAGPAPVDLREEQAAALAVAGHVDEAIDAWDEVVERRAADDGAKAPVTLLAELERFALLVTWRRWTHPAIREQLNRDLRWAILDLRVRSFRLERGGPEHLRALHLLQRIHLASGSSVDAIGTGLDDADVRRIGALHPHVLPLLRTAAAAALRTGRLTAGLRLLEPLERTASRQLGPRHPLTLHLQLDIAEVAALQRDGRRAVTTAYRALVASIELLGPTHPGTSHAWAVWARANVAAGDATVARGPALTHLDELHGLAGSDVARLEVAAAVAEVEIATGRPDLAIALLDGVPAQAAEALGPSADLARRAHLLLGRALLAAGRAEEAVDEARAVVWAFAHPDGSTWVHRSALLLLAEACGAAGRPHEALVVLDAIEDLLDPPEQEGLDDGPDDDLAPGLRHAVAQLRTRAAREVRRPVARPHPDDVPVDPEAAVADLELRVWRDRVVHGPSDRSPGPQDLAHAYEMVGRDTEALELYLELAGCRAVPPAVVPPLPWPAPLVEPYGAYRNAVSVLQRLGRDVDAVTVAREWSARVADDPARPYSLAEAETAVAESLLPHLPEDAFEAAVARWRTLPDHHPSTRFGDLATRLERVASAAARRLGRTEPRFERPGGAARWDRDPEWLAHFRVTSTDEDGRTVVWTSQGRFDEHGNPLPLPHDDPPPSAPGAAGPDAASGDAASGGRAGGTADGAAPDLDRLRAEVAAANEAHGWFADATLAARRALAAGLTAHGQHDAAATALEQLLLDEARLHGPDTTAAIEDRMLLITELARSARTGTAMFHIQQQIVSATRACGELSAEALAARYVHVQLLLATGRRDEAVTFAGPLVEDARRAVPSPTVEMVLADLADLREA